MKWITTAILAASLAPTLANAQGCAAWLLPDFWLRAGAVEVMGCEGRRVEERDEDGATAMHLAAGYGFVSAVNALALRDPTSVNRMDDRGYTPLHYAAELNANQEMISALLALGAVVDTRSEEDVSALDLAAGYANNPDVLRRLLAAGAKAAPEFDTNSHAPEVPIMFAARYNSNPAVLDVLLMAGADIHAIDQRGYGLLHMAIMSENQPEMMAALLARGVGVNHQQYDGYTPLMEAMFSAAPDEVFTLLIEAGADVNLADFFNSAPLAHAVGAPVSGEVFEKLVEAGADVFAVDDFGQTAMHVAAFQPYNIKMVERLLSHGANINDLDYERYTPLHMAASGENAAMIIALLSLGANPATPTVEGKYPYNVAMDNNVMQGSEALELLRNAITPPPAAPEFCRFWPSGEFWFDITLKKVEACLPYVDINARGHYDETPLMWALLQPDVDIAVIRALLSVGPKLGLGDIADSTALHYAASGDSLEILALLLLRGADPNIPDEAGQTPLHRATVMKADTPMALLLLTYGADPEIWDHDGRAAGDTEVEFQPDSAGN